MSLPDPKSKRYDRQIRIWGAHGQQRLESCRIALLNCGPTGSETLKNLVLGGIASFTIVDGHKVSATDLGNNFLVDAAGLGDSRAKVVTELLQELNDAVAGSYVEEMPEVLLDKNPAFFHDFDLVIATQMREPEILKLDELCRQQKVQLLVVRSYGLVGYLRISIPEHQVAESKPDSQVDDLRLNQPWQELKDYALSFDLGTVDDITHHHTPYGVLLILAAEAWKQQHGKMPSTSNERGLFKDLVNSMRRNVDGVPVEEENFDEALKAAFHTWTQYSIPSEVRAILEDEHVSVGPQSEDFWIMAAALKAYVDHEGQGHLPLEGSIPDMHATTDLYLKLAAVYREKAERDAAAVEAHVRTLLLRVGRQPDAITRETIRFYCKHARNLRLVRWRSLADETRPEAQRSSPLLKALAADHTSADASLYVLLRAVDRFHASHGRFPGCHDAQVEDDVPLLKSTAAQVLSECGIGSSNPRRSPDNVCISDDYVVEMVRFGAGELHVVAAFMGGVAAQEAIKIITGQFVPVAGTLIYNGISCTTTAFEL